MKTFVVWVLYIGTTTNQTYEVSPAIAVIDNIASAQNCQALAARITQATPGETVRTLCIAVRKVAP